MAFINTSTLRKEGTDYIYYDMSVLNRQTTSSYSNLQLRFQDSRSSSILDNPEDYKLSVTKFQLDTTSLPVFECNIVPNQGDRDLSIYSLTLQFFEDDSDPNANFYVTQPENIRWIPVNQDVALPPPPTLTGNGYQADSEYYYSLNFEHIIRLINTAFKEAMIKLIAMDALNAYPNLQAAETPFMAWNNSNQTATIYTDPNIFDQNNTQNIKIFFNRALYGLFSSFPVIQMSHNKDKGRNYMLVIYDNKVNNIDLGQSNSLIIEQEYSTIQQWSPVSSIVFTSSLPVCSTNISDPQIYENNRPIALSTARGDQTQNIITDFSTDEMCYKPQLLYYPTAQYRYISLYSSGPIRTIEISVWWKDKYSRFHPYYLDPGNSCSLKLLFERR